jgi:hypothetical protein
VSTSSSMADVTVRASDLDRWEKDLRDKMMAGGVSSWPFGDMIRLTLGDVQSLLARVAELEAERANRQDEPSVVGALIGSLRAAGYQVMEPGTALDQAITDYAQGFDAAASDMLGEDAPDDCVADSPRCGTFTGIELGPRVDHKAMAVGAPGKSDEAGTVCQKCKGALVTPGGPCRYLDCNKPPSTTYPVLAEGMAIRFTRGLYEGRYAFITGRGGHDGGNWVAKLWTGTAPPSTAVDIPHDDDARPILVEPLAPPPLDPPTTAEAPAAKARRAEEPPIPVAEWAPTDKDVAELAAKLGRTVDDVQRLVAAFKAAMATRPPAARWRPSFTAWATKNGAATLAQTAIPGA